MNCAKNKRDLHTTAVMPVKTGIQAAALVIEQTLLARQRRSLDTDFRRYDDVSRHSLFRTRSGDGGEVGMTVVA